MNGEKSRGKLELKLLGSPEVWLDGELVMGFRSGKARALLYYLVVTTRPQPRSVLAGLFWGGVAENHARRSLTMTLSNLRRLVGNHLEISRETIAFKLDSPYELDVAAFDSGVAGMADGVNIEGLKQAIALYRGDFLEGFYLQDAPEFEQWVLIERTRLRERVLQALHRLADHLAAQNDLPQAIETMRRLLALEPWREEAHRYLMLLLARDGQRSAALAQYDTCRQLLAEELAVEPAPETTALYKQIRDGALGRDAEKPFDLAQAGPRSGGTGERRRGGAGEQRSRGERYASVPLRLSPSALHHNLPQQPTSFVGRATELADIIRRLMDRDCRLLTLVGPGGIGKTRLALQVAQTLIHSVPDEGFFGHGIYFMPLAAVSSTNGVVLAIAEAIGLSFYGSVSPKQQLLNYLQKREVLLVLDNLEHLLSSSLSPAEKEDFSEQEDGGMTGLIADILTAAPNVKILVTSREALNLQEAWFHPVEGMSFPGGEGQTSIAHDSEVGSGAASLERYDAVQLFVQCATRARVEFSLAAERAAVVRICRMVEGMPLAIELAASWLRTLPVADIAAEIERGLDILTVRHQNVPERHHSMRVVLEQSWQLLAAHEREVFKHLSVFQGGFAFDAARTVAGASPIDLATFVDKSLLQLTSTGRYHMHELLRQYAAERLAEFPENVTKTYEAHCTYYADFLQQRSESLMGGQQQPAIAAIAVEYDNVWAAWRWALKALKLAEMEKSVMPLQLFCQFQSRYLEGADAWEKVYLCLSGLEATDQVRLMLATVIIWWGWMLIRLGRLDKAETVLKQCCDLYQQLGIPAVPGYGTNPRLHLSLIATIRGDYATALQYGERARRESESHRHKINLYQTYYVLASAAFSQGHYETARQYAHQAYTLAQEAGDRWFTAYCLNVLGNSELALGNMAVAQQHFEASYTLRQEFNDPEGMAAALNHLAETALRQQNEVQAQQLYRQSLAIYQDISDKGGLARTYTGLGMVASKQNDVQTAQQYLQHALRLTMEIEYVPLTLSILNVMGELLLKSDRPERGVMVLTFIRHHPSSDRAVQHETQQRLESYRIATGKDEQDILAAAQAYAKDRTLPEVVAEVLRG